MSYKGICIWSLEPLSVAGGGVVSPKLLHVSSIKKKAGIQEKMPQLVAAWGTQHRNIMIGTKRIAG